jgi:hypothetical protein
MKKNLVHYSIRAILWFILLSSALSFWNRHVTYDTRAMIDEAEECKALAKSIQYQLDQIDGSVMGFVVTKDPLRSKHLEKVKAKKDSIFHRLKEHLDNQGFDASDLSTVGSAMDRFIGDGLAIISASNSNDTLSLRTRIAAFRFTAQSAYLDFLNRLTQFEDELEQHARSDYEWSITDNAIIQIILILLSVPILIITSRTLKREVRKNEELIEALNESNRNYFYNDGKSEEISAQTVIEKLIANFKMSFQFVEDVSAGKYDKAGTLLDDSTRPLNERTLMGALVKMSGRIQAGELEDKKRQWSAAGLNQLNELVRKHQGNLTTLTDQSVSFLTKYLGALQGALFVVEHEGEKVFLELKGCYAYDRKKWVTKRVEVGDGLIGQVFLEGSANMLTELPQGYTSITSGLGDATPDCLVIVPFKFNDKIEAVFELSGFSKFGKYQIDFLEKAGELVASTLQSVRNQAEMQSLLNQAKEQAESLRAQEEELRQNMEELEATTESIRRRENL